MKTEEALKYHGYLKINSQKNYLNVLIQQTSYIIFHCMNLNPYNIVDMKKAIIMIGT